MLTLDKLAPGESGRILRLRGRGPVQRRLADMGLTRGAEIEVVKLSPLGDPVEYRLRGYHLTLRRSEARAIEVELLEGITPRRPSPQRSQSRHPLTHFKSGQQVEIVAIRGGRRIRQKLQDLDLMPGRELTVISMDFPGPIIVEMINGERIVIGRGKARHVLAKAAG